MSLSYSKHWDEIINMSYEAVHDWTLDYITSLIFSTLLSICILIIFSRVHASSYLGIFRGSSFIRVSAINCTSASWLCFIWLFGCQLGISALLHNLLQAILVLWACSVAETGPKTSHKMNPSSRSGEIDQPLLDGRNCQITLQTKSMDIGDHYLRPSIQWTDTAAK